MAAQKKYLATINFQEKHKSYWGQRFSRMDKYIKDELTKTQKLK